MGGEQGSGRRRKTDVFVLFLNLRPQFRVKEHSGSILPPLSPSAKHKNQNLHTYTALLCLGMTVNAPRNIANQSLQRREPGSPDQAGAASRARAELKAVATLLFPGMGSAPSVRSIPKPGQPAVHPG